MKLYKAILLTTAALLFLATLAALSLPYGYFMFLRIVVCGVALYTAFQARDTIVLFIGLLMIAIFFNPLIRIHFDRTIWRIIDLATATTFIKLAIKPLNAQNQS